jgi:hypothetical protein
MFVANQHPPATFCPSGATCQSAKSSKIYFVSLMSCVVYNFVHSSLYMLPRWGKYHLGSGLLQIGGPSGAGVVCKSESSILLFTIHVGTEGQHCSIQQTQAALPQRGNMFVANQHPPATFCPSGATCQPAKSSKIYFVWLMSYLVYNFVHSSLNMLPRWGKHHLGSGLLQIGGPSGAGVVCKNKHQLFH